MCDEAHVVVVRELEHAGECHVLERVDSLNSGPNRLRDSTKCALRVGNDSGGGGSREGQTTLFEFLRDSGNGYASLVKGSMWKLSVLRIWPLWGCWNFCYAGIILYETGP